MVRKLSTLPFYVTAATLICFACFLFSYETTALKAPQILVYTADFVSRFADMLLPMTAAAVLLPQLCTYRTQGILWRSSLLAIPQVPGAVLSQYLVLLNNGLDSGEAIGIGLLFAALEWLIRTAVYAILLLLAQHVLRRTEARERKPIQELLPGRPFECLHPTLLTIGLCGLPQLLISLVAEVVEIVTFLSTYFATFSVGEVLYMTVSFLFVPFSFILALYLAVKLCLHGFKAWQTTQQRHLA